MSPARFGMGRSGLRFRVLTLVGIGVLLPAALLSSLFWSRLGELDDRMLASRRNAVRAVAGRLDEELTDDLEALQRIASALSLGREAQGPEPRGLERHRELLRRGYLGFRFVGGLFLLDARGRPLLEEPQHERPVSPSPDLPELAALLRTAKPQLSGLVPDGAGYRIYAMVAVMDWRGQVAGVVGGLVDPALPRPAAALRNLVPSGGGHADLVDQAGSVLASTDRARVHVRGTCTDTSARVIREAQPRSVQCRACHRARGEKSVLSVAPLAAARWAVVAVQPESAVLATSGALPAGFTVLAVGLLLLSAVYAWGAARSVTGPVERLTAEAEKIAAGRFDEPIPDLGADEVGRLGRSLDRMRRSLAELLALVARANAELEARVEARTRELGEVNEKLRHRDLQRARLLRTVITAQEDERKRVARELHDETTQSLAVLAMGLDSAVQALRAGTAAPRLDELKALAVHLLEEVHRLILDLRPSVLDDLGLFSAVRWYAERNLSERGIATRCELGEAPAGRLPPELEIAAFRICQEAINNIQRHAQAQSVLIQLEVGGGELRIEIEDDGQGFDPGGPGPADRPHYGVMGIRERAELMGGTARIDSAPGQGTRVEVRLPIPTPLATPPATAGPTPVPASDKAAGAEHNPGPEGAA